MPAFANHPFLGELVGLHVSHDDLTERTTVHTVELRQRVQDLRPDRWRQCQPSWTKLRLEGNLLYFTLMSVQQRLREIENRALTENGFYHSLQVQSD